MRVKLMRCDQGDGFKDSKGTDGTNITQDGTGNLQHWTGLEGNFHLRIKGHCPK
jgi:hypothetical protein